MKTSYIIALLVIVIAGVAWFSMQSKNTTPVQEVNIVPKTETAKTPATETPTTPPAEQPVIATTSTGTDVGMEMPETSTPANAKVFAISGKNFSFDVKEIKVKKGDTVVINFTSADGFHDFVVDEFKAKTERVQTGAMTHVTFVADKTGTFEYYCSVGQHRMNGMVGKLIVE